MQQADFEKLRDAALRKAMVSTLLMVMAFVINLYRDQGFLITAAALCHVFLIASLGFQKGRLLPVKLSDAQNKDPKFLVAVLAPGALYLLINLILLFR